MKMKTWIAAALAACFLAGAAHAGSSINPNKPALKDKLDSPPIQSNFAAAYSDINNLLGKYASATAPANPTNFQEWADLAASPVAVFKYWNSGTATWIPYASLNVATGVYSAFSTSAGFLASAPVTVSVAGGVVTYGLSFNSNFQVVSNRLAFSNIASGHLHGNCSASTSEPTDCAWSAFADRAIGSTNGMIPSRVGGAWTTISTGTAGHAIPFLDGTNTWASLQVIYPGAAALRTALAGTLFRVAQLDSTASVVQQDTFGAAGSFTCMRSDGTAAVSTALAANDLICGFGGGGYDGTANSTVAAAFRLYASQGWTSTAHGTYARIATTANGTTTAVDQVGIEQDGGVVAPPTVTGGSKGQGTLNVAGGYWLNNQPIFTGSSTFTAGLPIIGNGASPLAQGAISGSTSTFATTSGTLTPGDCLTFDASGNLIDDGGACGAKVVVTNDDTTNAVMYPLWVTASTGRLPAKVSSAGMVWAPSTKALSVGATGTVAAGTHQIYGATNGTLNIKCPGVCGSNTLTFPAGTTDFSATGGTSQVLKQVSLGGAFTVGQLAASDLSNGVTGSGAVALASAPAISGGSHVGLTSLGVRDTSAAFDVTIAATSGTPLTAGRALTLNMGNVAHTLAFGTTANTITFPNVASDTVGMLATANAWTGNQTHSGTELFTGGVPSLANGNAAVAAAATGGGIFTGKGSTSDITIQNGAGAVVATIPTGTQTMNVNTLTLTNPLSATYLPNATNAAKGVMQGDGTTISCSAGTCTALGAAATSIGVGTTTVASGINNYVLTTGGGTLANSSIASLLTAGPGINITGTTNATIARATPAVVQSTSMSPAGTASTTYVMQGDGSSCSITPVFSSRVMVTFSGYSGNNSAGGGTVNRTSYGTGAAPANGAAASGTTIGGEQINFTATANFAVAFSSVVIATGLTPGTTYWFDLQQKALSTGSASWGQVACALAEL